MLKSLLNFFRKYVLKNLPFKLVSLAIAIMLWLLIKGAKPQPLDAVA